MHQLDKLATAGDGNTRIEAHQLQSASSSPVFIVCLMIISTYSALLEPVTQQLQAIQLDLLKVQDHVNKLLQVMSMHRQDAELYFRDDIFSKAAIVAESLQIELKAPRQCQKSTHRSNPSHTNAEDYFRKAIYIPYMDSLISSLKTRFSDENTTQFSLLTLQPMKMASLNRHDFKEKMNSINNVYQIDNFEIEAMNWFDLWSTRDDQKDEELVDILSATQHFFPAVREAILIALTLPATTCTVERSFSTLRRVKTWLRSTMTDERLSGQIIKLFLCCIFTLTSLLTTFHISGLCMMSVHRQRINSNKAAFIESVIDEFGRDSRRLQFLFSRN